MEPTARERRAADIRERILRSATTRVRENGVATLRARDVAGDAGIALGSIYKHFADVDDLVMTVNSHTLALMNEALEASVEGIADPAKQLEALALAYLNFAEAHPRLWSALFEYAMDRTDVLPQWYEDAQSHLFRLIDDPVAALAPQMDERSRAVRTRTVFSAAHGVVALALENRFAGVPRGALEDEVVMVARVMVKGLKEN